MSPFETSYYSSANLGQVREKLLEPIVLKTEAGQRSGLVIKEMPYQVGDNFALLASLATAPIIFIIRDPRLNISSRIQKRVEADQEPNFPLKETGWDLINKQIRYCQKRKIPYVIVEASDFRTNPEIVFAEVFGRLQLRFSVKLLSWETRTDIDLDNLEGRHKHLYERVLASTGIEPPIEPIPPNSSFPETNGFRDHIRHCRDIYKSLCSDSNKIGAIDAPVPVQTC